MRTTKPAKPSPTTVKIPATACGLFKTPVDSCCWSCWGFATTDVVVTNDPLLSVEVLIIVTSGGVKICVNPFESVDVEITGFGRVDAGCVVILVSTTEGDAATTVTEITVELAGPSLDRTEVPVVGDAVLPRVESVEEGKVTVSEVGGVGVVTDGDEELDSDKEVEVMFADDEGTTLPVSVLKLTVV